MITATTRRTACAALLLVLGAAALGACGSGNDSEGRASTSTTAVGPTNSGATGARPIVPFNPGERAGLGPWQLTLDDSALGASTTVDLSLTNPGARSRPAPAPTVFELVDLASRSRFPVASSTGLDAPVAAHATVPVTLTFTTGTAPANAVLAWKGSTNGSVDAAFSLRAAPASD